MDRQFEFDNNFAERLRDAQHFQKLICGGTATKIFWWLVLTFVIGSVILGSYLLNIYIIPQIPYLWLSSFLSLILLNWWFANWYNLRRYKQKIGVERFEGKPVIVRVGNRGISWQQIDSEASFDWVGVDAIHQGPKGLLFQYGGLAYILPNSVFPDKASRISFKQECETLMTKAKAVQQ